MKIRKKNNLVAELNRLMAEETEAFLRYFQIRYRLKGNEQAGTLKLFDEAMRETLEHAEAIANQIRNMGHTPTLKINFTTSAETVTRQEALAEILAVEQQALDAYQEFLPRVQGNPVLEDFIRNQIAVESEHVQEISSGLT